MKEKQEIEKIVKFTKKCLKEEGFSKELISYLFSTYDLETFIGENKLDKLKIASDFIAHARSIDYAGRNY